jgi:hypothetical protein
MSNIEDFLERFRVVEGAKTLYMKAIPEGKRKA